MSKGPFISQHRWIPWRYAVELSDGTMYPRLSWGQLVTLSVHEGWFN